ncbi:MAG: CotH kinase family protein [Verrucomicrobiales bacterium]|nr:CotH kinase family protein [Verrucomicrobiales bacterium]
MQWLSPPRLGFIIFALVSSISWADVGEEPPIPCVADTKFSVDRGHFTVPFQLEITSATEGATIRYTKDGSVPSLFGGQTYKEPIKIDQTTIIRAMASKQGLEPSNLDTQTYLFLDDVIDQSADRQAPDGWPKDSVNGQELHYGMNPAVVNRLVREAMTEALLDIPSFSLVTDTTHLFNAKTGIYVNPSRRGREWERPASLELISPSGGKGFQQDCGIRIRGGISRDSANPKHSFRVLFRREYGRSKLDYPLFGDFGADEFHNIDLRTSQNWTWAWFGAFPPGARQNTLIRAIASRDTQGALGQPRARSRYHHLYVNGVYWGVYMTDERTEAEFAKSYFGGKEEDYDVIKIDPSNSYRNENPDGNMEAWRELWDLGRAHEAAPSDELYFKMQGLNPDGTRNSDFPVLLDVDNLIDYLLCIYYTANNDAPVSLWINTHDSGNNWYGIRNRANNDQGFRFFVHDGENTFGIRGYSLGFNRVITTEDRTGPFGASRRSNFNHSNPQFLHQDLMENPEYQLRFADRAQKHLFHNGALTESAVRARLNKRITELESPILAHAARWGWATAGRSYDEEDWRNELDKIFEFVEGREAVLLDQLTEDDLYRDWLPILSHHGGTVSSGLTLSIKSAPSLSVFYTTDGTDPRNLGGTINEKAVGAALDETLILTESLTLKARVRVKSLFNPDDAWGPMLEHTYYVDATEPETSSLVISEIHYRPSAPSDAEVKAGFDKRTDFEFIEINNRSDKKLIMADLRLAGGVRFHFPDLTELAAGERLLVVNNSAAFQLRYGDLDKVVGEYEGNLSNGGERLALLNAGGRALIEFKYNDSAPWPLAADGEGHSLTFNEKSDLASQSDPAQWTSSSMIGGSPGLENKPPLEVASVNLRFIQSSPGQPTLTWNSETSQSYQVQGSHNLSTWSIDSLPILPGTGDPLSHDIIEGLYDYYRLLIREN